MSCAAKKRILAIGALLVATACDTGLEPPQDADATGGSEELLADLSDLLPDVFRRCGGGDPEACTKHTGRSSIPQATGFRKLEPHRACRNQNFAALEATLYLERGHAKVVASFMRRTTGAWKFSSITSERPLDDVCKDPPFLDVAEAKRVLLPIEVAWNKTNVSSGEAGERADVITANVAQLLFYGCAISKVEASLNASDDPTVVKPRCWLTDGLSEDLGDPAALLLPSAGHPAVFYRVTFTDGSQSPLQESKNPFSESSVAVPGSSPAPRLPPSTPSKSPTSRPAPSGAGFPLNRALVMGGADGSQVLLDGAPQCSAPCEIRVPVGDDRRHEVRLRKKGFSDAVILWQPRSVADALPDIPKMRPLADPAVP